MATAATRILRVLILLSAMLVAACSGDDSDGEAIRITGIVSDRSAAEVAAGAHRFLDDNPDAEITLRTPEQLATLSDAEVAALWRDSDAVVFAAVFGDEVGRLERLVQEQPPRSDTPVLAINGDRRLTRLSRLDGEEVLADLDADTLDALTANPEPGEDPQAHLNTLREAHPEQADWLTGRAYYKGRTPTNMANLMRWLADRGGHDFDVAAPEPRAAIRYYHDGEATAEAGNMDLDDGPAVALLDLDTGDRPGDQDLLDRACEALEQRGIQCFGVLARWGGASRKAVAGLAEAAAPAELSGVISLQDFVVGGGGNREAVTKALAELDVPVLKGVRLADRTEQQWRLNHEGVPQDDVHYKIAMPELQGISQPTVLATAAEPEIDERTGVRITLTRPVGERVERAAQRMAEWHELRTKDNADKRIAVIYYNHPPGRQNIGADKLDVPESLHEILHRLDAAGYDTGNLPDDPQTLLDAMQDRGVNLPNDREAIAKLVGEVPSLTASEYQEYFATLPETVRNELVAGPVGYLHARLKKSVAAGEAELGEDTLERGVSDLRDMVRNHDHSAQERALDLLAQFKDAWSERLAGREAETDPTKLRDALVRTGIPGLSGWGEPPGRAMTHDGEMLFPGMEFGNVFIGPQPPRGWEVHERLLHANTTFPPTHQYVGFYHWLRDEFDADAIVYVGRHSTREFLPRRRTGLTADDYPDLLGGDLPVIYPYIVDGVGEGIQAKRRVMGVMISHLTPPLATTELYDELLELRQLVETYESGADPDAPTRQRAADTLRTRIEELDMTDEIRSELARDHDDGEEGADAEQEDGDDQADENDTETEAEDNEDADADVPVDLDAVDDDLLVHEVGHYVTEMQEHHMPLGLHVFGRDWDEEALSTMLESMAGDGEPEDDWRDALEASPANEHEQLLAGLDGRFITPSQGNDPVRTPAVLPTGRNFHALSSDLIPTRIAWSLGQDLAADARGRGESTPEGSEAIILWASDTVRDEGVMIAFGLDMLGLKPKWNSRGIVEGLERRSLDAMDRDRRRDALFTTSGLFRDLYGDQLVWLDRAARMALAGAGETIRSEYEALAPALDAALEPLPGSERDLGTESLAQNDVAAQWVADAQALIDGGADPATAGEKAALRVFGSAPGAYGTGVNRLAERSGAWSERSELADVYVRRMGHAYGERASGEPARDALRSRLKTVGRTYLGRASHVYGLLDNDDGFDFQGGLSAAVEDIAGGAPDNRVLQHADPDNPQVESLQRALRAELRGTHLNPQWIEPLMEHDYAGARTMTRDFIDNLWGWQVTNPEVVGSRVWDEVHDVYLQDRHDLGLDEFLEEGHKVHVKTHIQAIMLIAAERGFWEPDPKVLQKLSEDFAELVAENGLPGSGHTRPDHPVLDEIGERLDDDLRAEFDAVRAAARSEPAETETDPSTIREIEPEAVAEQADEAPRETETESAEQRRSGEAATRGETVDRPLWPLITSLLVLACLFAGGLAVGLRGGLHRV